jgi:hypothetical protein
VCRKPLAFNAEVCTDCGSSDPTGFAMIRRWNRIGSIVVITKFAVAFVILGLIPITYYFALDSVSFKSLIPIGIAYSIIIGIVWYGYAKLKNYFDVVLAFAFHDAYKIFTGDRENSDDEESLEEFAHLVSNYFPSVSVDVLRYWFGEKFLGINSQKVKFDSFR